MTDDFQPGNWIARPFWEASVQVITAVLGRCVRGDAVYPQTRFGYAAVVTMDGYYVGPPEELPPDTRLIRLHRDAVYPRTVSPMSPANKMKTAISLSELSAEEASIALELSLELKGEVNEHPVKMELREIQKRVAGLPLEGVG